MSKTIEISRELVGRITETCMFTMLKADYEELRTLLAAPAIEGQEPVDAILLEDCVDHFMRDYGRGYFSKDDCAKKVYASPPAPVAVVPDDWEYQLFAEMERRFELRKHIDDDYIVNDDTQIGVEFAIEWIFAHLDKVKEMNK